MGGLKMIVGLGNSGPQYSRNRHNIGFQIVERFAARHNLTLDKMQMRAMTGTGFATIAGQRVKVLLAKPLTFMNASGDAVAPLARYFQVEPADMIVIHDDLDMASGKLRLRPDGSSGGQNGIRSIIERLGTAEFARGKVGIGRPPGRMDPAAYVLQNFSDEEEAVFGPLRLRVCDAIEMWLAQGIEAAMNQFNG
ncbi:MAG: aminoacyl-tRNA hydrolase [Caldilineaceae bacterium]|nr:aminoacyl-tRNA hydrolase [Caldilineaceae bacterium]